MRAFSLFDYDTLEYYELMSKKFSEEAYIIGSVSGC
jgi:hypothetical protein